MKLSTAMMLGSTTCKMEPGDMSSCAYGAALNAVGDTAVNHCRYLSLWERWPWLFIEMNVFALHGEEIYKRFDSGVCKGEMTFEQLVDYVASIEPDCGTCNRFDCSCVKSEALPVTEEVTV